MTRRSSLLQDADPLRQDPPRDEAVREKLRQTMLRATASERSPATARVRLRLLAAVTATIVMSAGALSYQLGTFGTTPLFAAVRFEMRLAEDAPAPGLIVAQTGHSGRLVYVHPEIIVNNDDIDHAWTFQDAVGFGVAMKFLPSGALRIRQATTAHVGRPLALLIDGRVVSLPTLRSAIGDSANISGAGYTQAEAQRIADSIGRP